MSDWQAPDEWNVGNTGCGELLVKLFLRMRALVKFNSLHPAAASATISSALPAMHTCGIVITWWKSASPVHA
jgi:hypothetical protein